MRFIALMTLLVAVVMAAMPVFFSKEELSPAVMEQPMPEAKQAAAQAQKSDESSVEQPQPAGSDLPDWESFNILNRSTGEIEAIPVKDYVVGALCSEMPATFHTEALKAQAVSAHTWALYCQRQARLGGDEYDFSADPQNWQGYVTREQAQERFGDYFDEYWGKINAAADSVWQEVVVDSSQEPIVAAYHAISSGRTESAQNVWGNPLPYLVPVESPGDIHANGYQRDVTFTYDELKNLLQTIPEAGSLSGEPSGWMEITARSGSGYVTQVRVGSAVVDGLELRDLLGLRSSDFDFTVNNSAFSFTTKGYGHGVGLSQYGADYLARQGWDYKKILEHYYTGAQVVVRA